MIEDASHYCASSLQREIRGLLLIASGALRGRHRTQLAVSPLSRDTVDQGRERPSMGQSLTKKKARLYRHCTPAGRACSLATRGPQMMPWRDQQVERGVWHWWLAGPLDRPEAHATYSRGW